MFLTLSAPKTAAISCIPQSNTNNESISKQSSTILSHILPFLKINNVLVLTRDNKVLVPDKEMQRFLVWIHDALGHPGIQKTIATIRRFYFFKKLEKEVTEFVYKCDECRRNNTITHTMANFRECILSDMPLARISTDIVGLLQWRSLMGLVNSTYSP